MSATDVPAYGRHTLRVFVTVDGVSEASVDKRIRQALARWPYPDEPTATAMYMADFLYVLDGEAEEAWRSSGTSEAHAGASGSAAAAQSDAADRLREASLAQLHTIHCAERRTAHSSIEKALDEVPADVYFNTLLAPPAASWTVADFALTPVALLFGLEVYADEGQSDVLGPQSSRLQPRLGPNAPLVGPPPLLFGNEERRGLLDAGRVRVRLGEQQEVKVDSSNAHLVLSSLSAIARLSGPPDIRGCTYSAWTLSITEDELIAFEEAMKNVAARLDRAAQVGDAEFGALPTTAANSSAAKTAEGDLRQDLSNKSASRDRGSKYGSWQVRAGALGAEHLNECGAAHLIPAFMGDELFEDAEAALAARSQRFGEEELRGDDRAPPLGFLDPRVGSLYPMYRTADAGISAAHNGLFLRKDQHALFDMRVFFITPAGKVVHITQPVLGRANPLSRQEHDCMPKPGWEVPLHACASALAHLPDKTPSIHLAALGTLLALYAAPSLRKMLCAVAPDAPSRKRARTSTTNSDTSASSERTQRAEPARDQQRDAGEQHGTLLALLAVAASGGPSRDERSSAPASEDDDELEGGLARTLREKEEARRASEQRIQESREIERVGIALFVAHTERRVGAAGV